MNEFSANVTRATCASDLDSCINCFSGIIDGIVSPTFKRKTHSLNENSKTNESNKAWYTEECFNCRQDFFRTLNLYRLYKTEDSRVNMTRARTAYKSCIRKCKFDYDKLQTENLIKARHKNAKIYWNMLKKCAGIKQPNVTIDVFKQYFKSVNDPSDPFFTPDDDIVHFIERYENNEFNVMFKELNEGFSIDEVTKAINQLKTNKSGGPDLLLNEFLMHGKHVLAPCILSLFNKLFELEYFPDSWSEGFVIPLHKKGSINDEKNYRGITLLSILGKLFTRIINNRLSVWAENYSVYVEAQAGFRSNMSTVDNIFVLHGIISHIINEGKQLYCAFIDFTKAFDYVVRDNLWTKLIKLGLRGNILNIIRSMYVSVKSRIKVCNQLSDEFDCVLGVRQGECLSPFLFSMFLNDIEDVFLNSGLSGVDVNSYKMFLMLYADDIVIFANNGEELQLSLDLLEKYCKRWKLVVNTLKSKIMVFRKGGRLPQNLVFYYNNNPIEIVNKFSYLGIVFTASGSFSEAQKCLAGQGSKGIFSMNKYLHKFTEIPVSHKLNLFRKLVLPIFNYGSEIWGFVKGDAIERVHLQFFKRMLGVKTTTQNDFIYGELGITNLQTSRYYNIIKYWLKLMHSKENKYIQRVYKMLLSDLELHPNKKNWCSLLKDLLCSLGFYEIWLFQDVGHSKIFLLNVRLRLKDQFIQGWNGRLQDSSRARLYKEVANFCFQPYLDLINVRKFRISFTRLRVSAHRLRIETGRWARPYSTPLQERTCLNCNVLEDEYHFVIECPLYIDLRIKYVPCYYRRRPNMQKFVELINLTDAPTVRKLSMFIYGAMIVRNEMHFENRHN